MSEALREEVLRQLADHHVMTLATAGADGLWAAAVFYANDGTDLYFLSSPASRHGIHLAEHGAVAATIQRDYADWPAIKGIQMEGEVALLGGAEETYAREVYARKFPLVGALARAPAVIVKALAKVRWYRLRPRRLFYIDNGKGFGHRDELPLRADGSGTAI